ncbi:MAG TPA: RND transporter [Cytophagales bacterium]|nr:RND transporter [Cytophagales bacterium]HAP59700.1 RND transporter [Cytophagales bacterium]
MKRTLIIVGAVVGLLLVGYFVMGRSSASSDADLITQVVRGEFRVEVTTTGELEAKKSTNIMGPANGLRQARLYEVTIQNIVPEGTKVRKGQWVASLDPSTLNDRIADAQNEYEQSASQYDQTQLDTALELRAARDEIENLRYGLREAELQVEQSAFEPPATQEKLKIDLEKAKKKLVQAKENYELKVAKAKAQMREAAAKLREDRSTLDFLMNLNQEFRIMAPEDGMVIYRRNWNGKRIAAGDQINAWDPTVATLPDLSKMVSRTYVNEVDIRRIKSGQEVEIGLDAYPDKRLTGVVTRVANVGEQKKNSDAKVFEVSIEVNEADTTLRPAMTTSNTIVAEVVSDVLYIPLECLHSQGDTLTFVYIPKGSGISRQEVRVGASNANEAVIVAGLEEGQDLFLSIPESSRVSSNAIRLEDDDEQLTANR